MLKKGMGMGMLYHTKSVSTDLFYCIVGLGIPHRGEGEVEMADLGEVVER
jgi:hypothetical protein